MKQSIVLLLWLVMTLNGETIVASSCSSAHVTAAIASASTGDIVSVPSGTCSWSDEVIINKSISVIGQTTTSKDESTWQISVVANTTIEQHGFDITATSNVRVSGFVFDMSVVGAATYTISVPTTATNFRIDHNHFYHPDRTWFKTGGGGYLNILFDHNLITQPAEETLYIVGAGDDSWAHGGACDATDASKATILEDNEFTMESGSVAGPIDSGEGARFIIRYNRFSAPTGYAWQEVLEAHGHCWGQRDGADNAGGYCQVIHNNKVYKGTATNNGNVLFKTRGGRSYIYKNSIFGTNWADSSMVRYWVQEVATNCNATPCAVAAHSGIHTVPLTTNWLCTSYPCPMQPKDSYIWGNTMESGTFGVAVQGADPATYMAENRDYWDDFGSNHAEGTIAARPSTCTTNHTYWATDTETLDRCTATDTWTLIYTAFGYPHPLQVAGGSRARGNMRVSGSGRIN